jgi:hypothetical protein
MRLTLYLILSSLALCGFGCASYKSTTMPILQAEFAPYSADQNGVTVSCKAFSPSESKRYLGRDVQAKGYQPIQISVQNESKSYILLSPQSLNVPLAPPEDVARLVHTNTVGRAAGWGVAGLFIWPLLIPAVVDGVGSSQANQKLDADYSSKGVNETVIQPYTTLNRVVFVPKSEWNGGFRLTLLDKETRGKMVYEVRLPAGN